MKKLLSAVLTVAVSASCVVGFTACGSNKGDAETAKSAISYLKMQYDKLDLYETESSYTVFGKAPVNGKYYDVNWSVSENNITDYISVGAMDEDNLVTISVSRPENDIEYKLNASVKVGKATESYSFSRKLKGLGKVYTVAELKALDTSKFIELPSSSSSKGNYYTTDNSTAALVAVKGYVVDPGSWSTQYNNYTGVYIVDEYSADKSKSSSDAMQVYRIVKDDVYIKDANSLKKGDLVTLQGCVQYYSGKIQMSYQGSNNVTCLNLERETKSDEERVADALGLVTDFGRYTAGSYNITTSYEGVAYSYASSNTALVDFAAGKMTITAPESDTDVTVTVTASVNGKSDNKTVKVKVVKASDKGTATNPLTLADVKEMFATLAVGETYRENGADKKVYIKGFVTDVGEVNGNYGLKSVYIADVAGTAKEESVLVYDINWGGQMTKPSDNKNPLKVGDQITITGYVMYHSSNGGTYEIGQSGSGSSAIHPEVTAWIKRQLTDDEKLAAALEAVRDKLTVTVVGEYDLPASTIDGVTLVWSTEDTTYTIEGNKLNVEALPDEPATVTASVVAKIGADKASQPKTVTITVKKPGVAVDVILDFVKNYSSITSSGWGTTYAAHTVTFAQAGENEVSGTVVMSNANKQNSGSSIDDRPVLCAKDSAQYVTVSVDDGEITAIEFDLKQWASKTFADIHIEYYNGTTWVSCSAVITTPAKLAATTIPAGVTQVRLSYVASKNENTQIGLTAINLTVA